MVNIYKTIFSINKGEDMSKILKNVKKFLMEELKVEYMSHFTSSPYINIESLCSVSAGTLTHTIIAVYGGQQNILKLSKYLCYILYI